MSPILFNVISYSISSFSSYVDFGFTISAINSNFSSVSNFGAIIVLNSICSFLLFCIYPTAIVTSFVSSFSTTAIVSIEYPFGKISLLKSPDCPKISSAVIPDITLS